MRILFIAAALAFSHGAAANPTGGTVSGGSGTISQSGSTVTVTTSTNNTIINWQSFSVGAGESTRFNQPSTSSTVLNRVTGPDTSSIAGSLSSNGHVYLVNPNGVVIAPGAQIDVASLLVTTLSVDDASFLSGNPVFTGNGNINVIGGGPTGAPLPTNATITTGTNGGLLVTGGGTLTVNGSSNSGGITNTGSFNIGAGGNVSLGQPGGAVTLAASSESGRGVGGVLVRAPAGTATPSPAVGAIVAQSGMPRGSEVALNLEKREVPF